MPRQLLVGCDEPSSLRVRLAQAQVQLNTVAEQLFADPRFTTPPQPEPFTLEAVSVGALGHAEGATFDAITCSAAARGLAPCPLVLAPWLRLMWLAQPAAPTVEAAGRHRAPAGACTVTSLPPPDEPDLPWGFYLRRIDGAAWLRGYRCWSGHVWAPEDWLVFQRIDPAGGPDPAPTRSTPP